MYYSCKSSLLPNYRRGIFFGGGPSDYLPLHHLDTVSIKKRANSILKICLFLSSQNIHLFSIVLIVYMVTGVRALGEVHPGLYRYPVPWCQSIIGNKHTTSHTQSHTAGNLKISLDCRKNPEHPGKKNLLSTWRWDSSPWPGRCKGTVLTATLPEMLHKTQANNSKSTMQ